MASLIHFYHPLAELRREFDDAFNPRFRVYSSPCTAGSIRCPSTQLDSIRPRMDVKESKDSNVVTATFEFPGLKSEDVTVELKETRLTVSGESSAVDSQDSDGYAILERRRGKLARTLQVPFGTKAEDVKAKMENGVLTVTFPKTVPEQESRRITIQ